MATVTEIDQARMDTMGGASDSRTAPAVRNASNRHHAFPADRRTEEVIAERMLMAALLNYRRVKTGAQLADFRTHDQMTDVECAFYETAVRTAYAAIWEGR